MGRIIKQTIIIILTVLFTLLLPIISLAAESYLTAEYLIKNIPEPTFDSVGGEWTIVGLSECSYPVPEGYFEKYYSNLAAVVKKEKGILSEDRYTEYSRVIIALSSIGKDASNVAGYDLSKPLKDYKKVTEQGLNGAIYALMALNSGRYTGPKNELKDFILQKELPDGGWNFWGNGTADLDITAMAVQALSAYRYDKKTKQVIERALPLLKEKRYESCETVSQVILALSSLGIKPDESYRKQLLKFCCRDGSFKHLLEDEGSNIMSTEQALMALSVFERD